MTKQERMRLLLIDFRAFLRNNSMDGVYEKGRREGLLDAINELLALPDEPADKHTFECWERNQHNSGFDCWCGSGEPPAPLKHQGYDGKIHEGIRSECTKCKLPERRDWCSICGATVTIPHEHFQPDYNALNRGGSHE